eukprot:2910853-Pyramimonas_sp.AAC.1
MLEASIQHPLLAGLSFAISYGFAVPPAIARRQGEYRHLFHTAFDLCHSSSFHPWPEGLGCRISELRGRVREALRQAEQFA